mgnify:CR=1 FL=1
MKYDIQFTNQFKKDLKLAKKQNKNLDKLFEVIDILANGGTLDAKYRIMTLQETIKARVSVTSNRTGCSFMRFRTTFSTHALQAWYALRTIQKIDLKNRIAIQKASIRNGRCFSYAQIQERRCAMAGSRIKGITVEIGGDTTKLQSALKGVNSEIKNTQSQLKDVEKLLKYDALQREIIETEEYLKKL